MRTLVSEMLDFDHLRLYRDASEVRVGLGDLPTEQVEVQVWSDDALGAVTR